ncbi:MAG: hypothetical protein HY738_03925 [Bacteroidia bacterium]|nr:hypothetical protein [Bacteroidia bacterium]
MRIIKTEKQKDNLTKYLYDISKIIIAVMVIGPIAKPESFNIFAFVIGVVVSIIFFLLGQTLDKKEIK